MADNMRRGASGKGNKGSFLESVHQAPEDGILDLHHTLMAPGETRVMPVESTDCGWYTDTSLSLATKAAHQNQVQGTVGRVPLPADCKDPAARYAASLRSAHSPDTDITFTYDTGDQRFEQVTPAVAEVLTDAATKAHFKRGRGDEMEGLIALLGEKDARDLLAQAYLDNGEPPAAPAPDALSKEAFHLTDMKVGETREMPQRKGDYPGNALTVSASTHAEVAGIKGEVTLTREGYVATMSSRRGSTDPFIVPIPHAAGTPAAAEVIRNLAIHSLGDPKGEHRQRLNALIGTNAATDLVRNAKLIAALDVAGSD